jgi:hypothetical protein
MHIRDNATKRVAFVAQTLGCEWIEKGKETLSTERKRWKRNPAGAADYFRKGKENSFSMRLMD